MAFARVVFPLPLGPVITVKLPFLMSTLILSSILIFPFSPVTSYERFLIESIILHLLLPIPPWLYNLYRVMIVFYVNLSVYSSELAVYSPCY